MFFPGSAVVVSGESSKRIYCSEKEAIIGNFYTGNSVGTCLAWSMWLTAEHGKQLQRNNPK